ncbi:MAG: universal stress protein, partial [Candidatus Binatia bacterium]|nr:universal stress protein [Candidatus Binatia bacterium]
PSLEAWRTTYTHHAHQELQRLAEQCGPDLLVETVVLEGRAHAQILAYLEQTPCDVVVMGTHGRPWYQRFFLGSTADTVLRASSLPVLIVHNLAEPSPPPRLHTLLLPLDLGTDMQVSAEWALHLTAHPAATVILLHAVENPLLEVYEPDRAEIDPRQIMEASRQHPPRSAQPFWEHAHTVARAKLVPIREQLLGSQAQVELMIREGPAADTILEVAAQKAVDLIVMATHGRSGVRRFVLGSVTEKVVRAASCPVLAVHGR